MALLWLFLYQLLYLLNATLITKRNSVNKENLTIKKV